MLFTRSRLLFKDLSAISYAPSFTLCIQLLLVSLDFCQVFTPFAHMMEDGGILITIFTIITMLMLTFLSIILYGIMSLEQDIVNKKTENILLHGKKIVKLS